MLDEAASDEEPASYKRSFEPHYDQRRITRVIAKACILLLKNGAESSVVEKTTRRIGLALGVDYVDVALIASGIVVTSRIDNHCITTTRHCPGHGINMQVVIEIQHLCVMLENKTLDLEGMLFKLNNIHTYKYNRWLVVFMIGLSCAAFCHLRGGDLAISSLTFLASSFGMMIRQEFTKHHFNPLLTFTITAFVTTLIASTGIIFKIGNYHFYAMACSVLMLVPGFPIINSVSDMVKGYVSMGIARGATATLLTFGVSMGIVAAMHLMNVSGWL